MGYFEEIRTLKNETTAIGSAKSGLIIRSKYPDSHIILIDDTPDNGDDAYDLIITHKELNDTKKELLEYLANNKLI